jgi:DNA-binding CsgD family transcriptional regulator
MMIELTETELKVAELVATGMTNAQIATKLWVTVKAIEWHLSNVYRKTGCNRAELRVAVATEQLTVSIRREATPVEPGRYFERLGELEAQVARLTRLVECLTMTPIEEETA